MGEIVYERGGSIVRVAGASDNADLCELLRKVHIKSDLDVTQERDPDFFRLLKMHQGEHEVLIGRNAAGTPFGVGSVTVRDGWVDGEVTKVGYLSDLRVVAGSRGARVMPRVFSVLLERARERWGAELFYTVIFDDNALARRVLTRRSERRRDLPIYETMTPFWMTNVQFLLPARRPRRRIERARDLEELADFLGAQQRRRPMGDVLDADRLSARLSLWPGLSLEHFLIARDERGGIAGCVAPYDADVFKRTRVLGYHGSMRWVKTTFDVAARVFRAPRLPDPKDTFRFAFLSHLEVENDDPAVLADLVRAAYAAHRHDGLHFLSAMIPRKSPLTGAFGGFVTQKTPMTLYAVTLPQGPHSGRDFQTVRPGFEMTLS